MKRTSADIRKAIESNWKEYLSRYANLFSSNFISGSSPPSVFVGSYGYPKVLVGPMVPPLPSVVWQAAQLCWNRPGAPAV